MHLIRLTLAAALICLGWEQAPASPPPAAAAPASNGASQIAELKSTDVVDYRVAQAMLAHRGTEALAELEAAVDGADDRLRVRLKEVVALMLVRSVDLAEMQNHPKLMALPEKEFQAAAEIAKVLADAKQFDSGEEGPRAPHPPEPLSRARQAIADLTAMGGYAVPAAIQLAKDRNGPTRLYAVQILGYMRAEGQINTLLQLRDDSVKVRVSHGDYDIDTTIAEAVKQLLRSTHPFVRRFTPQPVQTVAFEAENYVVEIDRFERPGLDGGLNDRWAVCNRLRWDAATMETDSWREYWVRARPILKEVWKGGEKMAAPAGG